MRIFPCLLRCLLCVLCCLMPYVAQAKAVTLEMATAELTVDGQSTFKDVHLPYGWDLHHPGISGFGRFTLEFDGPPTGNTNTPWALYFHRLGNAYVVKLNGVVLEQNGALNDLDSNAYAILLHTSAAEQATQAGDAAFSDYAKIPRFVRIPAGMLLPHNQLEVSIRSDSGRRSGMPAVMVGPKQELEPLYQQEFAFRVAGSGVLTVFSLIVGVFSFVLWISQTDPRSERRGLRDNLYLFAAVAEFSWAFFLADTLIERPPLPWHWWSVAINMALGIWLSSLLLFSHTVAGWERHAASGWVRNALLALLVVGPVVAFVSANGGQPMLLMLWQAGFAVVFVPSAALFIWQALHRRAAPRRGRTMHRLVALAFVINIPVGLHDFYAMRIGDPFGNPAYLRYTATLFGLVLGAIAIVRFRSANLQVHNMLDTLATRIAGKEQELSHSYQRLELVAREQARVQERARILRDMHDGVGSHISSAIRQLQSGRANQDEILLTLMDSLDQLKLSIDALHLPPGDITALLANLRYRLEPRFRTMGLALEWAVGDLPQVPRLDASAMRQLQYIFFEAFSNVMQHAHASVLRIEAKTEDEGPDGARQGVRIRICDNGRGFDTRQVNRQGLASMEERAAAIGAQVQISSQPGATVVEIALA